MLSLSYSSFLGFFFSRPCDMDIDDCRDSLDLSCEPALLIDSKSDS